MNHSMSFNASKRSTVFFKRSWNHVKRRLKSSKVAFMNCSFLELTIADTLTGLLQQTSKHNFSDDDSFMDDELEETEVALEFMTKKQRLLERNLRDSNQRYANQVLSVLYLCL
jgi:hypothetical protein